MDRLDQYRIFVCVAEMGSFIKAAHALELPRATVSAAIQQLETGLEARVLHRTTRQVRLTTDGIQLLDRLRNILTDVENIEQLFKSGGQQVAGRLNIEAPSRIARKIITPALPNLLRSHPRLHLSLGSTDRLVDLVQEGVDCAMRVGSLQDSSLVARPLGHLSLINCASPDYLQAHGMPRHPEELLTGHFLVAYACPMTGRALPWDYLDAQGQHHTLDVPSRILVNSTENYLACCQAGLGLIQVPRYDVQQQLRNGELIEVMPQYRPAAMPVSLVYPHRKSRSRRLTIFANWLEKIMQPYLDPA